MVRVGQIGKRKSLKLWISIIGLKKLCLAIFSLS